MADAVTARAIETSIARYGTPAGAVASLSVLKFLKSHPIAVGVTAAYIHTHPETTATAEKFLSDVGIKSNAQAANQDSQTERCSSGYQPPYRVVEPIEHAEIKAIQRYVIPPEGLDQKQFWLNQTDPEWFAGQMASISSNPPVTHYLVTSSVCVETLAKGYPFTDAGHQALSFGVVELKLVNRDAAAARRDIPSSRTASITRSRRSRA